MQAIILNLNQNDIQGYLKVEMHFNLYMNWNFRKRVNDILEFGETFLSTEKTLCKFSILNKGEIKKYLYARSKKVEQACHPAFYRK